MYQEGKDIDQIQVSFAGKVDHSFAVAVDRKRACIVDLA
jgi:hypothetical protein